MKLQRLNEKTYIGFWTVMEITREKFWRMITVIHLWNTKHILKRGEICSFCNTNSCTQRPINIWV